MCNGGGRLAILVLLFAAIFASREIRAKRNSGSRRKDNEEEGRIVGGTTTSIENHPHQVSLRRNGRHICGGSIIEENWVVTAAHCVAFSSETVLSIKAGSSTLGGSGQVIGIKQAIVHPNYSSRTTDYDVAVLELEESLSMNSRVQSITLAAESDRYSSGTTVVVTGWGTQDPRGSLSEFLREVYVPLVSTSDCAKSYGSRRITDRMICAGNLASGGKDACQGDSGGPMVQTGTLIGIVSWGSGCANARYPGVYTRVSALRSWIDKNTGL